MTIKNFEPLGNINTIGNFIDNRFIDYSEETFFKKIFQIKGGEAGYVNLDTLKLKKFKWYNLKKISNKPSVDFLKLFEKSIKLRLRSDVEVGSCLSGGVDSSSIVCVADKQYSNLKKKNPYKHLLHVLMIRNMMKENLLN